MNKDLTALECVEELKRLLADSHIEGKWSKQTHKYFSNIVETIEITLKAYEKTLDGLDAEMRKNQKALEIIKEKPIVALVDYKYTYEEWLELVDERERDLFRNKEEYEFLKEVLL